MMTMDEPRKGFVYYRGFFESLKKLPDDEHFLMYKKVCEYALYGVEPLIEDVRLRIVFDLMREQIDANQKRYENGKKGGAPRGNRNAQKSQEQPKSTENNKIFLISLIIFSFIFSLSFSFFLFLFFALFFLALDTVLFLLISNFLSLFGILSEINFLFLSLCSILTFLFINTPDFSFISFNCL